MPNKEILELFHVVGIFFYVFNLKKEEKPQQRRTDQFTDDNIDGSGVLHGL